MNFLKAKETYRKNAIIQKNMAQELVRVLNKEFSVSYAQNILEIGAGTGLLTDEINANIKYEKLFLNDLTENFTNTEPFKYYKGDILTADLKEEYDLIISNAAFQWVFDKKALFLKLKNRLKNNGVLAFTTFGKNNFKQIKNLTGLGLDYSDAAPILANTGFNVLYFEEEHQTLYFNSVKEVLEHIKFTGATAGSGLWTKKRLELFKEEYLKYFSDNNGVELTYHPQYYIARL